MKKKELAVGDSTEVEIIFSTGHYSSRVTKSASISCNAQGNPPGLTITAWPILNQDSLKLLKVSPFSIALDSVKPEDQKKALEYEVSVKNTSPDPLELSLVSVPTQFVKVDMPGGKLKPGKEKMIKVKIDKDIENETFTKSFTIEASDSAKTRVTVAVAKNARWGIMPASVPTK